MRVLPSSFTVARKSPSVTWAVSTGSGRGIKPITINATNTAAPSQGSQRLGWRRLLRRATVVAVEGGFKLMKTFPDGVLPVGERRRERSRGLQPTEPHTTTRASRSDARIVQPTRGGHTSLRDATLRTLASVD